MLRAMIHRLVASVVVLKALLDALIENDTELEIYARAVRIAVTGEPD